MNTIRTGLMLGFLMASACGDDEDDALPGGGDVTSEIRAQYNCDNAQTGSCDQLVCLSANLEISLKTACASPAAPQECSGLPDCYSTYLNCVTNVCPTGMQLGPGSEAALEACSDALSTCLGPISGD